jgi:hypothetical protein
MSKPLHRMEAGIEKPPVVSVGLTPTCETYWSAESIDASADHGIARYVRDLDDADAEPAAQTPNFTDYAVQHWCRSTPSHQICH